jgi:amidase
MDPDAAAAHADAAMADDDDAVTALPAVELAQAVARGQLGRRELMAAYLARIERLNPRINALVGLRPAEDLLAEAAARDDAAAARRTAAAPGGWLDGLPLAVKDLAPVAGLPWTLGFAGLRAQVAREDGLLAARLRAAGAILIGKTNTSEFGLGSHSYNEVWGTTRNALDARLSAGGSSGGAAAALGARLLPVADGSDMMGSLRNPAGWNGVWGLRPSQGRVPALPAAEGFVSQLGTEGPMARHARDLAALYYTLAGCDRRAPLALDGPPVADPLAAARALAPSARAPRIGWLADLGGHLPTEPGVLDACEAALGQWQRAGVARVDAAALGFSPERLWDCWLVHRHWLVAGRLRPFYDEPALRAQMKPEALWEVEGGQGLSAERVYHASAVRSAFFQQLLALFERFDLLALPTAQCFAFPAEWRWPQVLAGHALDTYHRWMEVTIYATLGGVPALAVPCRHAERLRGHAAAARAIGIQLLAPPRRDEDLLRFALAVEPLVQA